MLENYPKEKLQEIYESIPQDLKEALFSQETANSIHEACTKNSVGEEKIPEVAKHTGYVLMGLLPPDELEKTLEFKVGLTNEQAKNINQEITRFVFFPLRAILETLYKTEVSQVAKPKSPEGFLATEEAAAEDISKKEKPPAKRRGKDTYREPVE